METNIDPTAGVIVKFNQTGCSRHTPEYKCEVLSAFEASVLIAPVFVW
jgi:hypothetical protein